MNALVVDDEEDICDFLKEELETMGFRVSTAISGEQAMSLIQSGEWDLLIADLKLSTAVTGLEVIKAMRQKCPRAVVAAMSGYVDVGLRQETEKLGIQCYLEKPGDVQPDVFCGKIQSLMGKK